MSVGINVFPGKVWSTDNPVEVLDYADLDSAGQPLFAFFSDSIGADQVDTASMNAKIEGLGGPGIRAFYIFTEDFTIQAGFQVPLAQFNVPGVTANSITFPSGILGQNVIVTVNSHNNGVVNTYVTNNGNANITISKGVRFEMVFFNLIS